MAENELIMLLEIMLQTFSMPRTFNMPRVKPGGHPEELFLDLTEEQKEEIECSICYQILKEARQCNNKHKFCHSCILVWTTSGNPENHSKCPVCRATGGYAPNTELDEKINELRVKCSMKTCKWKGPLERLKEHQHTTYSDFTSGRQARSSSTGAASSELPALRPNGSERSSVGTRPESRTRARANASSSSQGATASSSQTPTSFRNNGTAGNSGSTPRRPLGSNTANSANTNAQSRSSSVTNRGTNTQHNGTTRSRTRSRTRNGPSPQRRSNQSATGLPANGRLTSRARIRNGGGSDSNGNPVSTPASSQSQPTQNSNQTRNNHVNNENADPNAQTTSETVMLTPRPPTTPRPAGQSTRRLPTLPGLISVNSTPAQRPSSESQTTPTDSNNNLNQATNNSSSNSPSEVTEPARQFPPNYTPRRLTSLRSFGTIRDRLNESRQRLDILMQAFSTEIDRGRQDLSDFQIERERRRQEQMSEVRDLGRRLTVVATELRGLLSQRRQIRSQIDNLAETATDED